MDELRKPFLLVSLVLMALVVLIELGSSLVVGGDSALGDLNRTLTSDAAFDDIDPGDVDAGDVSEPPGRGITATVLLDGFVLFRIGLMGLALIVSARVLGRVQGCATCLISFFLLIGGLILLLLLFVELIVMTSLFLAAPFGTIAYLAIWGFFPRGDAAVLLSLIMLLKLGAVVSLVLAQQRFLKVKSLVLLLATSVLATWLLAFLHALVPNPLTSIADQIGAIIVVILGLIWLLLALIGSIPGILKAIRVDRALKRS